MSSVTPVSNTGRVGAIAQPTGGQAVASDAVEPEALVVTHCFDSGEDGEPYSATIRLRGQRVGIRGKTKPGDTFTREDTVDRIVPGSGPVSITTWVYGLEPGDWTVTGDLDRPARLTRTSSAHSA